MITFSEVLDRMLKLYKYVSLLTSIDKDYILSESIRLHNNNYKSGKCDELSYYIMIINKLLINYNVIIENRNRKIDEIIN